jgi:hypothetical protein
MYKIIGADQKEYGPVTIDQIRQWISENRVNAQTRARAEAEPDWKPLSAFPEFAELLGVSAPSAAAAAPAVLQQTLDAEHNTALQAVRGPAVGLIVSAVLNLVYGFWQEVRLVLLSSADLFSRIPPELRNPQFQRMLETFRGPVIVSGAIGLLLPVLILIGALKMQNLRNYALSMTGPKSNRSSIDAETPAQTPDHPALVDLHRHQPTRNARPGIDHGAAHNRRSRTVGPGPGRLRLDPRLDGRILFRAHGPAVDRFARRARPGLDMALGPDPVRRGLGLVPGYKRRHARNLARPDSPPVPPRISGTGTDAG